MISSSENFGAALAGLAVLRRDAMTATTPARRGAVYTRKPSEEGLAQDLDSRHAQREACEAFIHRTWRQPDGLAKASFSEPRLSLGPIGGGAVRLPPPGELLLVGDGIETTASGMAATRLPAWAALSATGLERLILPSLPLPAFIILADNDVNGTGEKAAQKAAPRWLAEGRRVRIAIPPEPGSDFNDLLLMAREGCGAAA